MNPTNDSVSVITPINSALDLGYIAKELKSGATKARLLSRKEYGEAHNLKGAELKRQHYAYLKDNGVKLGATFAGSLAGGQVIPQGLTFNPETGKGQLAFVTAEKFGHAPAPVQRQAKLSDDALLAEVMRRKLNVLPLLEKMTANA